MIDLNPSAYGTHSLRRTKVALIYKKTGNLRACQLLLGHGKLESTVRYLGIEVDDALEISEQIDLYAGFRAVLWRADCPKVCLGWIADTAFVNAARLLLEIKPLHSLH
jgi:hypothetical protein